MRYPRRRGEPFALAERADRRFFPLQVGIPRFTVEFDFSSWNRVFHGEKQSFRLKFQISRWNLVFRREKRDSTAKD